MASPIVNVVIPNYNGLAFLPRLLATLAEQTEQRFTITVVDDQSNDGSVAYLRAQWPEVRLIQNKRRLGFAGGCNAGIMADRAPFVALLNNDTYVEAGWLAEALRPFERTEVGSVASLVLLAEPPHLIDTAGDVYSVVGGAVKRHHLLPRDSVAGLDESCFSACGASAFYRRAALDRVGLLDVQFESYYEDVDLGFRLAWAGFQCVLAPGSVCYHHLSASYSPTGWRYHFNSARNAEVVWRAHVPEQVRRRRRLARSLFLFLQSLNKLRQGCLRPYLAGKWAVRRLGSRIDEKHAFDRQIARIGADEIDRRLVQDWWGLHVRHRAAPRSRPRPTVPRGHGG